MTSLLCQYVHYYMVALVVLPCLFPVTRGKDTPGVNYMYCPMSYLYSKWIDEYHSNTPPHFDV